MLAIQECRPYSVIFIKIAKKIHLHKLKKTNKAKIKSGVKKAVVDKENEVFQINFQIRTLIKSEILVLKVF